MRRVRTFTLVAAAAALLGFTGLASAKPESDASWTSFGHDQQLTAFSDAPAFTTQVKGFALAWKAALSGAIVASPLSGAHDGARPCRLRCHRRRKRLRHR